MNFSIGLVIGLAIGAVFFFWQRQKLNRTQQKLKKNHQALTISEDVLGKWQKFVEVWITGNDEVLDEIFAPDLIYHLPPFPDMNLSTLKQFIVDFRTCFPDFRVTTDESIMLGNTSAHRWHCEASFSASSPLLPVAPTGKLTRGQGSHFNRMEQWLDCRSLAQWRLAKLVAKSRGYTATRSIGLNTQQELKLR